MGAYTRGDAKEVKTSFNRRGIAVAACVLASLDAANAAFVARDTVLFANEWSFMWAVPAAIFLVSGACIARYGTN